MSDTMLASRIAEQVRFEMVQRSKRQSPGDPRQRIEDVVGRMSPLLAEGERSQLVHTLAQGLLGIGPIHSLLEDPSVSDVLVNGPGPVWVERSGRLEQTAVTLTSDEISRCIERLVAPLGLRADRSHPVVDARLDDGTRVNIVLPPLAPDGPLVSIRRHPERTFALDEFGSPGVVRVVERIIGEQLNVLIYGSTGSGKTSLVNSMSSCFDATERVVIVEDTSELRIVGSHVVRLESRPHSPSGRGGATIRDLVRVSLRLRPDRLIVGEVRGPEALDMVWAMSTGHRGSISTCHASGPADALRRIETMMLQGEANLSRDSVGAQVDSAIDVLVGMTRGTGGHREIARIDLVGQNRTLRPLNLNPRVARC